MRDLLKYIKPSRGRFTLSIIFMLGFAILSSLSLSLIAPFLQSIFYDQSIIPKNDILNRFTNLIIGQTKWETIIKLQIVLVSIFLIKGLFGYIHRYLAVSTEENVIRDIRKDMVEHIYSLSLDHFHKTRSGTWVSKVTNDIGRIERSIYNGLLGIIRQIILMLAYLTFAIYLSWKLLIVTVVIFPIITKIINILGRKLRERSEIVQENIADVTSQFSEGLSGMKIIKSFLMEKKETSKILHSSKRYFKSRLRFERIGLIVTPLSEFIITIGICAVISYGAFQVFNNYISPDRFIIFLACVIALMEPLKRIPPANVYLQQGLQAMKRIKRVLSLVPSVVEDPNALKIESFKENIVFKNVSFSYNGKEDVLKNVNFEIKKGESIALVGPSGAGKSTIADLFMRFYDPTSGSIEMDGLDLKKIRIKDLINQLGLVTQEPFLFNDTIGRNITYGDDNINKDRMILYAKLANADEFIKKLPDGYNTLVGERGVTLSGGERQRISIARALYSNPEILIFDEATSHLDQVSEKKVQDAIEKVLQDRTALVIAHRLSTVKDCTRIVVIDNGMIVEEGTHEQLMEKNGLYKKLVKRGLE